MDGWIKLHRVILDWEWYDDHNTTRLFLHLLMRANHKPAKWRGVDVDSGSLITGRDALSLETGMSVQSIRTSLKRLKSTNEITIKKTNRYSIISINNWDKYQVDNQQANQQLTINQPASNQQVTTDKNEKNEKNEKKVKRVTFIKPSISELSGYIAEYSETKNKLPIDAEAFLDFYESKGWMVGKNKMADWKAAVRTWFKDRPEIKNNADELPEYLND